MDLFLIHLVSCTSYLGISFINLLTISKHNKKHPMIFIIRCLAIVFIFSRQYILVGVLDNLLLFFLSIHCLENLTQ